MKLGCFSVLLFCTALLLSGCGAREPQEPAETTPPQTAAFTRESKIKDVKNPSSPKYIQTVKGIGYRFNKEV